MRDSDATDRLALRLEAIRNMTPATGFNAVGVDDFEDEPGDDL